MLDQGDNHQNITEKVVVNQSERTTNFSDNSEYYLLQEEIQKAKNLEEYT